LLVFDDAAADSTLLPMALQDRLLATVWIDHATTLESGLARLDTEAYDGVVLSVGQPHDQSSAVLAQVLANGRGAAIVFVTGTDDADLAREVLRLGAQDYLVRSAIRTDELGQSVDRAIDRQRTLRELHNARDQQLREKDQFLSHVSHELRSPLSVVNLFAQLLLSGSGGPVLPEQRELLTVLKRNAGQLKVMIDDLLQVTRGATGRLRVTCRALALDELLAEAVAAYEPTALGRRINLSVTSAVLPTVLGDAERLHEVLTNLIGNALKFTPDGGEIGIEAVVEGDNVCVTVRDNGRGLHPGDEERIFEKFIQVNQNSSESRTGIGLGLYICRQLVELQGGVIRAATGLKVGAAITFTIPILTPNNDPRTQR